MRLSHLIMNETSGQRAALTKIVSLKFKGNAIPVNVKPYLLTAPEAAAYR